MNCLVYETGQKLTLNAKVEKIKESYQIHNLETIKITFESQKVKETRNKYSRKELVLGIHIILFNTEHIHIQQNPKFFNKGWIDRGSIRRHKR